MIIELKWDRSAEGAIAQIKDKKYEFMELYIGASCIIYREEAVPG